MKLIRLFQLFFLFTLSFRLRFYIVQFFQMYTRSSENKTFCEKERNDYKLNKRVGTIRELSVNGIAS